MKVLPLPALTDNYIWMILDDHAHAWVVDPGEAAPVLKALRVYQCSLQGILITHHHGDHTGGVAALIQHTQAALYGPPGLPFPTLQPVSEGKPLVLGEFLPVFQVVEIPGHTLDHVAYYTPGHLFCGDTLFAAGCGRVFEGTLTQLYHSLQRLAAYPPDTQLYCAHEYTLANLKFACWLDPHAPDLKARLAKVQQQRQQGRPSLPSCLAEELQTNPFLRCHVPEFKASIVNKVQEMRGIVGSGLQQDIFKGQDDEREPASLFALIRTWKDRV